MYVAKKAVSILAYSLFLYFKSQNAQVHKIVHGRKEDFSCVAITGLKIPGTV